MNTDIPARTAPTPVTWLIPAAASEALKPLLGSDGALDNVFVRLDTANAAHHVQGHPKYGICRYAVDASGESVWIDQRTGLLVQNVEGWALAE